MINFSSYAYTPPPLPDINMNVLFQPQELLQPNNLKGNIVERAGIAEIKYL